MKDQLKRQQLDFTAQKEALEEENKNLEILVSEKDDEIKDLKEN